MDSQWQEALTFGERLALLRASRTTPLQTDVSQAVRRLERWQRHPAFSRDPGLWEERFAEEAVSHAERLSVLGEPSLGWSRRGASSDWVQELESALVAEDEAFAVPVPPWVSSDAHARFLALVRPLINRQLRRIQAKWEEFALGDAQRDTILSQLLDPFLFQISCLLLRTLVLELHIAREQQQLSGEGADERFRSFAARLEDPAVRLALLREYPVLARLLVRLCRQWGEVSAEFLSRVGRDHRELGRRFAPGGVPLGALRDVRGGLGDFHCGGRSVLIATFERGNPIVYKPHSLAGDAHFAQLVAWLNARGQRPPLRAPAVLTRGDYGWMEFVPFAPCREPAEIARFYRRQGSWLALLFALAANDFHFENLIASGEHPVPVDLESLFQPRLTAPDEASADAVATEALRNSVLSVHLLPQPLWKDKRAFDMSGLGGAEGQMTPFEVIGLEAEGTDQMRITRMRVPTEAKQNRPLLAGRSVDPVGFVDDFEAGFAHTYRLLERHRDELLSAEGPLPAFATDPIRVIVRPTLDYLTLQRESWHPHALRRGLDQERVFDHLWIRAGRETALRTLIPSECRQLASGDIPYFSAQAAGCDLVGGDGTSLPGALAKSGLAVAVTRLRAFGDADLANQLGFIRQAFTSVGAVPRPKARPALAETPLSIARQIGKELLILATRRSSTLTWLAPVHDLESFVATGRAGHRIQLLPTELYNGLAGVALFLAYLDRAVGGGGFRGAAAEVLATIDARCRVSPSPASSVSGFSGATGLVYLWMHLSHLWRDESLVEKAERLFPELARGIEEEQSLDFLGGIAGAIPVLLRFESYRPHRGALPLAVRCGERLLAQATARGTGLGWDALVYQRGFSHGTAGIAWALGLLGAKTGSRRFSQAAVAACAWETELTRLGQWNESDSPDGDGQAAWCHGAPGIALCRMDLYRWNPSDGLRENALGAWRAASAAEPAPGFCLCHGKLGNFEVLTRAAEVLADDGKIRQSQITGRDRLIDEIVRVGWRGIFPPGDETIGLMTGLSGIGYGLLRLSDPAIPSVLRLEGPKA